jgi:membrane-bound serine protease (ClpP class)
VIRIRRKFAKLARKIAFALMLLIAGSFASELLAEGETREVLVINVSGGIDTGTEDYILDAIEEAEQGDVACLVMELDTPGGMLSNTQEIVKRLLNTSVPVVVFVSPKGAQAASAGTFITMAAHVAVMAPGTRIGAAHPVNVSFMPGQGDEEENKKKQEQRDYMMEKVENDTVSFIVGAAKQRGRNTEWAEKAVRESVSITSDVAVKENVVDLEASTLTDLLEKIDGREVKIDEDTTVVLKTKGAPITRREMSLKQRLLHFLADPNILMILMALGGLGIMMEFYHPGTILPGVVGAICLLLAFTSLQILPVSWGAFLLVVAGIAMFIAEVYVTSYGLLGIGGAICFLIGGILLIDPSREPHYVDPNLTVDWSVLIPLVVTMGLVVMLVGYFVMRAQRKKIETGTEGMQGLVGDARSEVNPQGGKVFVRGEHWKAVSEEVIPEGSKIEVIRVEGLLLHVKIKV